MHLGHFQVRTCLSNFSHFVREATRVGVGNPFFGEAPVDGPVWTMVIAIAASQKLKRH